MQKIAHSLQSLTEDMYRVSAIDIADKIIEHLWSGWDPLQFSNHQLTLIPFVPTLRKRLNE
jgi:hypothetical protein